MTRRSLSLLAFALASLGGAAEAYAAQPAPGFPKKLAQVASTPVCTGLGSDGPRFYLVVGASLECVTSQGTSCPGFPVDLGEKAVASLAPAVGDLDGDRKPEVAVALVDGRLWVFRADGTALAGFSYRAAAPLSGTPSFADLEQDGRQELIFGTKDGKLHALNAQGAELRGFPLAVGAQITSPISVGPLGQAARALVSGNDDGKVYAVEPSGKAVPGFPVASQYLVSGQPALGDISGDGTNEVVFASQDFKVYAARADGQLLSGYPGATGARNLTGPALGDLEGEGHLDVVVASLDGKLHAFLPDGSERKGWPVKLGEKLVGAPAIADLDRDGKEEVLAASADGQLHVLKGNGKPLPGFPAKLTGEPVGGPVVVEAGDGASLIAIASGDRLVAFKVKRAGKASEPFAWPEPGHDPEHSGRMHPNPPTYANLKISPAEPRTDDALKAEYRFFDLDGDPEPATEIRWLRDGKEVAELAGKRMVPKELTKKKERWRFQVAAPGGPTRQSPEATIANTPPGKAKLAFDPPALRRAQLNKVKIVEEAADPDGDTVSYRYLWLKNGQPQRGLNKAEVPPGTMRRGERWSVVVVALDGESEGAPVSLDALVEDSAPTTPEIAVSPTAFKVGDALQVSIKKEATDADGDAISYRYRYLVDSVPLPLASTLSALPPMSVRKKQTVAVEVRADDGELLGPPATLQITAINTPPTAPEPAISPREAYRTDVLLAGLAAPSRDVDGDKLSYRFAFTRDGKPAGSSDGKEVTGLKKGETYQLQAIANDGEADSAPGKGSITIKNSRPSAPGIAFEGLPLRRTDPLKVKVVEPSVDPDGDAVRYSYAWLRDGKPEPKLTGPELPALTAKKGERWTVVVTPSDGQEDGPAARLETLAVDSVPVAPEVALSPAEPKTGDAITAVIRKEASDADGDRLKYRYRFFVDGTPVAQPPSQDGLPAFAARKKQLVTVEVRADDGEQLSPAATAKATVLNTAPEAPKAVILPAEPRRTHLLQGALSAPSSDADQDRLSYRFTFSKDGKKVASSADGREVAGIKKGEVYDLEVVANDGEADSAPAKVRATVKNSRPTAPVIAFETLPLRRIEPVKVRIATASTDADGDKVSYSYQWSRDGQVQKQLSGPELPAGTAKKGERWSVAVTPNDGEENGPTASLEAVVADSAPTAPEVALSPAEPKTGDSLKAVIRKEAVDPDGDKLKYRYRFLVDGLVYSLDPALDTLPPFALHKKQQVVLEVVADDGELTSPVATAKATAANTVPESPKVALHPAQPRRGDVVQAALAEPATDADGDKLTYRFTFIKDGKAVAAGADGREVSGIKKGETYELEVVASDGEVDSAPARAKVVIRNTAPTAPAVSFASEAPRVGEAVEVKIDRPSTDADGDAVTAAYQFAVDGKPASLPAGAKSIPAGVLRKHQVWTVQVTPSDNEESGQPGRARLEVVNTAPTAPKIAIEPAEPTAETGARARIVEPATDLDGDSPTYRYAWYRDGVRLEVSGDGAAIGPSVLHRGESLRLVVTAYDGEVEGAQATANARVRNSAPSAPQIAISPEKPGIRDELTCVVKSPAKDPDGETPALKLSWRRNGEPVPMGQQRDRIPAKVARHGETWSCEAVAFDGELSSPAAKAEVKILNTPPTAPEVRLEPEAARANSDLRCRIGKPSEDADDDRIRYAFSWFQGNKPVAADSSDPSVLPASSIKKGQGYRCEVVASDGEAQSAAVKSEARYQNSAPGPAIVRVVPETPVTGATLSCELVQQASDPDGDKLRYRYGWSKNGVEQSFADSSAQVPSRLVKAGDIWRCLVVASDGEADGAQAQSPEVIIGQASASASK